MYDVRYRNKKQFFNQSVIFFANFYSLAKLESNKKKKHHRKIVYVFEILKRKHFYLKYNIN